jgi:hypothetical protein
MEVRMRGYVLTMDVTVGAAITILIIIAATSYVNSAFSGGTGDLSMKRVASDVVALLDYNGTLGTLEPGLIESGMAHLTPPNMEMGMNITAYDEDGQKSGTILINHDTEKDRYGGKWCFISFDGADAYRFAVAEYWVAFA